MEQAFRSLTLDGEVLEGSVLAAWMERYRKGIGADGSWKEELLATIGELVHEGMLTASTSGTTGPPKRLRIPRGDLLHSAQLTAEAFSLKAGDRVLLCLPCTYIAGKMMVVRAMALGLDLHASDPRGSVLEHLDPEDRFRFAAMVPLQLDRALQENHARVEQQFGTILLGGGPLSAMQEERLQGLRTAVYHGYGSTETLTHVALRRVNGAAHSTDHQAIGRVHFEVDPRGCLVVHTPHLSCATHHTNDQVDLIDAHRFRWLGRSDNVILSGGKKVHPEQLEARTAGVLPWPHYFTAVPDDRLGQAVALVLETATGAETARATVMPLLEQVLQRHELPRAIRTIPAFRRTASGKLVRRQEDDPSSR